MKGLEVPNSVVCFLLLVHHIHLKKKVYIRKMNKREMKAGKRKGGKKKLIWKEKKYGGSPERHRGGKETSKPVYCMFVIIKSSPAIMRCVCFHSSLVSLFFIQSIASNASGRFFFLS